MSITRTTSRWVYTPNGATTAFGFDNLVQSAAELQVSWIDASGNALVLPSYTVSGVGSPTGGAVTFATAPAATAGSKIVLERISAPVTTGADAADFLQEDAQTRQFYRDKGFALVQEAWNRLKRTIQLSPLDADGPMVLPPAATRASMALLFDAMGRLTVGAPLAAGALTVGAWVINNLLPMNSRTAALAALGAMGTADNNTVSGTNAFSGANTFPTQLAADNSTKAATTEYVDRAVAAGAAIVPGYLKGFTLSTGGASAVIGIAAGTAADSTNAKMLVLAAAFTKSTASWAVGTGTGGLDTGAIANDTCYHWYAIRRPDTGVVDVTCSLSAAGPTVGGSSHVPAAYTQFRRLGSRWTNGSAQWRSFLQVGDDVFIPGALDFNPGGTSTLQLRTLASLPTGIVVVPMIVINLGAGGGAGTSMTFAPGDFAAGVTGISVADNSVAFAINLPGPRVPTNTSAQINIGVSAFSGGSVSTTGWTDRRGRDD